ncbi:MAG: TetR family transcriptional regulator C-terminal domain-containing protein [Actinomycetota bacterium]
MPKVVDHDQRRRQITDAVCRITLRGGLAAATFREVAAEAGVSVRLIQHYFGTKATLLEITQQHVGERSIARLMRWVEATDGSARAVLEAFLKSFVPADDESRVATLMYIALYTESIVPVLNDSVDARRTAEAQMAYDTILEQLERGPLVADIDVRQEARLIMALMPGVGQYVLDRTITVDDAYAIVDHHLDRLFGPVPPR